MTNYFCKLELEFEKLNTFVELKLDRIKELEFDLGLALKIDRVRSPATSESIVAGMP